MIKLLLCEVRTNDSVRVWSTYASGRKDTPLFTLTREQESDSQFLCEHEGRYFVSNIRDNCGPLGKYVDSSKECVPLISLEQFYLIEKRVDNEQLA